MSVLTNALHAARRAEKEQALFYRSLAALAEDGGDGEVAERLNGLHADEQHHLSRITARLVELAEPLEELPARPPRMSGLEGWKEEARRRERMEISRYETLLRLEPDAKTARMIREFLDAERRHATVLGGKWMAA